MVAAQNVNARSHTTSNTVGFSFARIAAIACLLASAHSARAEDLIQYGTNRAPQLKPLWTNVTITRIADAKMFFRSSGGADQSVDLSTVFRVISPSDAALNAGEEAFVARQYDKAIDAYKKVLAAGEAWKISWCVPRLMEAAAKTKRFDAALAGYIGLTRVDPAAAASIKPELPPRGSKFLDEAVRELDVAARTATKDGERQALLAMLLDVHLARGDQAAAETAVEQLVKASGGKSTDDPALAGLVAEIRLGQARVALQAKRYADVDAAIAAAAPRLSEPKQQAEALFLRAEAMLGRAPDAAGRLDAAIAFMRVVAHFSTTEDKPFVGQSFLRASDALESAGNIAEARTICEQVGAELPATPFAAEAAQRLARLTPSNR